MQILSLLLCRLLKNLRILQVENNKFEDRPLLEAPSDMSEIFCPRYPPDPSFHTIGTNGCQGQNSIIPKSVSCEDSMCFPSLEILKLGGNSITCISSLSLEDKFPNLKLLALHDNKIAKVTCRMHLCLV